jgi:hypothetical protein
MMTDNPELDGDDRAIRALGDSDYRGAADAYVLGAYGTLAGYEGFRRHAFTDRTQAGRAVCHLVRAAVCHRIAGDDAGARNRAMQGALVAVDLKGRRTGVDVAACDELVGHCRVAADDTERASEAYDRAATGYEDAALDDPAGATTRPLLQAGTDLLTHLSRPDDVEWDDIHGTGGDALARRVRFVRSRLPSMVKARVDAGTLHAPRGSTEYGTDFRCPECSSTDVNYVAEAVLCLRCDAPIEFRS